MSSPSLLLAGMDLFLSAHDRLYLTGLGCAAPLFLLCEPPAPSRGTHAQFERGTKTLQYRTCLLRLGLTQEVLELLTTCSNSCLRFSGLAQGCAPRSRQDACGLGLCLGGIRTLLPDCVCAGGRAVYTRASTSCVTHRAMCHVLVLDPSCMCQQRSWLQLAMLAADEAAAGQEPIGCPFSANVHSKERQMPCKARCEARTCRTSARHDQQVLIATSLEGLDSLMVS